MKSQKIIFSIVILLLIIGAIFFINKKPLVNIPADQNNQEVSTTTVINSTTTENTAKILSLTEKIWSLFDTYIARAKAHDIEGVKKLSFQQSAACADIKRVNECYGLMDIVVGFSKGIKKDDYNNLQSDSRQLILSTDFKKIDNENAYGYSKGYLVMIIDKNGDLRMLNFNPDKSWFYTKNDFEFSNKEVMEIKLTTMIKDTDNDGLTENQEICGGEYQSSAECTNTDPNKLDSDKDGWWDGVEFFFYKK